MPASISASSLTDVGSSRRPLNPRNNDDAARTGNFISIEIANKNETKNRFNGPKYGFNLTEDTIPLRRPMKPPIKNHLKLKLPTAKIVTKSLKIARWSMQK